MLVSTLPITPKYNSAFTTLISPFVACIASDFYNCPLVIANNLIGLRFSNNNPTEISSWYKKSLKSIGIKNFYYWSELDQGYLGYVYENMNLWYEQGVIRNELRKVFCCPCGIVEILDEDFLNYEKGKLYSLVNGSIVCNSCGGRVLPRCEEVLILNQKRELIFPVHNCFPGNFLSELKVIHNKLAKHNILVSRSKQKNSFFWASQKKFFIDTDFIWSLYLAYLSDKYSTNHILISASSRVLAPLIRSVCLSYFLRPNLKIDCIISPIVNITSSKNTKKININDFINLGTATELRFFLESGLHWKSKEVSLDTSVLYWIKHSIKPEINYLKKEVINKDSFILKDIHNGSSTRNLLAKLRKKRSMDEKEILLYQFLCQPML